MTRQPAAPSNLRNGLKWRDGRPRWEPSPANRACGFAGMDLRDHAGGWMDRGAATTAADARTLWARLVREAMRDDGEGSKARSMLAAALERLPPAPVEVEARHRRALVADLIERARAVIEAREPDLMPGGPAPRTIAAMVEGYFNDPHAMRRISRGTQGTYRTQSKKLIDRFGRLRVEDMTRSKINLWYREVQQEVSTATANIAIGAAGAMFKWAMLQDPAWIHFNPCTGIERDSAHGRLVFWTWEEERDFIAWCDANEYADVADCVTVCLWTGARQSDVCAANIGDLAGEVWRFVPIKTQRKRQEAVAGLLSQVTRRVERRTAEAVLMPRLNLQATPFLISPETGGRHNSASIGKRFRQAKAAAIKARAVPETFEGKKLQDTRDTCVTRLWQALGERKLERIATWGGWSLKSVEQILRDHYLTLMDQGAVETATDLEAYARACGVEISAA